MRGKQEPRAKSEKKPGSMGGGLGMGLCELLNDEAEVGQKFKFKRNSMNIHQLLKLLLVEKKSDAQFTGENRYLMNIHQRSK